MNCIKAMTTQKIPQPAWPILGLIVLLAVAALAFLINQGAQLLSVSTIAASAVTPSPTLLSTVPQRDEVRLINGMEMVYIPSGEFLMGSSDEEIEEAFQHCKEIMGKDCNRRWFEAEAPQRFVDLEAFWIDRTEVTNAQYKKFLDANSDHPVPYLDEEWARQYNWDEEERTYPEGRANHPVVLVTWYDADAYCRWREVRLPTEAEWERAASWDPEEEKERKYPWGDEFDKDKCNISESGIGETRLVGEYSPKGDSPYGLADMAGNVWEWVADWYDEVKVEKVLRGGSWTSSQNSARSSRRFYFEPVNYNDNIGFRCACSEMES